MYFVVLCKDKPNSTHIRAENRDAHLDYLKAHSEHIKVAGPFLDEKGSMVGSMLIIRAETTQAIDGLLQQDPYAHASLFEEVTVQPWRWVVGEPKE